MFTRTTVAIVALTLVANTAWGFPPYGYNSRSQMTRRQPPVPPASSSTMLSQALAERSQNTQRQVSALSPVTIETIAPQGIDVGQPARFVLNVYNTGQSVTDAIVVVEVPEQVKLRAIEPQPQYAQDQVLQFWMKQIPAKGVSKITVDATSNGGKSIEFSTKLVLTSTISSVVKIQQPELTVECEAPEAAVAGNPVQVRVRVANEGTGAAQQVRISPVVSEGARLVSPQKYPLTVGTIEGGRGIETVIECIPGPDNQINVAVKAEADNATTAQHSTRLAVRHPALQLKVEGPTLRYINRTAIYQISVVNPGDSMVEDLTITATIPQQLQVTGIESRTEFDRDKHTLTWKLAELEPNRPELLGFEIKALEEGNHATEIVATAKHGVTARTSQATHVVSRADLSVNVVDSEQAVEVGGTLGMIIELANRGSRAAENVQVKVKLPEALELAEGNNVDVKDGYVVFPTQVSLGADEKRQLKLDVIGRQAGDHLTEVVLSSDSLTHDLKVQTTSFFYDGKAGRVARKPATPQTPAPLPEPTSSRRVTPETDE